ARSQSFRRYIALRPCGRGGSSLSPRTRNYRAYWSGAADRRVTWPKPRSFARQRDEVREGVGRRTQRWREYRLVSGDRRQHRHGPRVELLGRPVAGTAAGRGAFETDRSVLEEGEGDEVFGVENFQRRLPFGFDRRLQRQCVKQRQTLLIELEPVVDRRSHVQILAVGVEVGEEAKHREGGDIYFGERRQFGVAELAIVVDVKALRRE